MRAANRSKSMTNGLIERRSFGGLLTAGLGAAVLGGVARSAVAAPTTEQIELVRRSNVVLDEARHDPQFGNSGHLFQSARGVMVVPQLVKGGFFVGGEGGNGTLMARHGNRWSDPAFYTLASASFGLQIGLEVAEVVLFVMSGRALNAWMRDEVRLGGQAGLTVLVVGSNAAASSTTNVNVDVIAWAKAKGAYAGLTLEGSIIKPKQDWNIAYYGRQLTPVQILNMRA
jgi:lipid-binding SYLF domain-containing protein